MSNAHGGIAIDNSSPDPDGAGTIVVVVVDVEGAVEEAVEEVVDGAGAEVVGGVLVVSVLALDDGAVRSDRGSPQAISINALRIVMPTMSLAVRRRASVIDDTARV